MGFYDIASESYQGNVEKSTEDVCGEVLENADLCPEVVDSFEDEGRFFDT